MKTEKGLNAKTVAAINRHYNHAKKKHQYFCDKILPEQSENFMKAMRLILSDIRLVISEGIENRQLAAYTVVQCKMLEFVESVIMGDTEHAIEKFYDAIAVMLRVIDVLEGRQELGNPKEGKRK